PDDARDARAVARRPRPGRDRRLPGGDERAPGSRARAPPGHRVLPAPERRRAREPVRDAGPDGSAVRAAKAARQAGREQAMKRRFEFRLARVQRVRDMEERVARAERAQAEALARAAEASR